ncbi:MAG: MOSC domain-containing protein [Planctomycetaceae bacterium]|nr:MOSC domain-containing protein [Planctomycetaceae bacterium]
MTRSENRTLVGHISEICRYPVKSMQGESPANVRIGPEGLEADRRFAVIDTETGHVASAKNPRKWRSLLDLRAELHDGVLVITAQNGKIFRSDHADFEIELSRYLCRAVTVRGTPLPSPAIEIHWPDLPGMPNAGSDSVEGLPAGGFFDLAPIHLLTTATLRQFRELVPGCGFDSRRFRPNLVIETLPGVTGFVENAWVGRTVVIGDLALSITAPCSRCVMTTLSHSGLSADQQVLRAAVTHNSAIVGVYGSTLRGGLVSVGDPVWLVDSDLEGGG